MSVEAVAGRVVLVHGMALPARSLGLIGRDLAAAGYGVVRVAYRTREADVAGLVEAYLRPAIEACGREVPVHLVTHSLGGILARQYLQSNALPAGSRIVMLAPPNHGSEVVDHVRRWPAYRWLTGTVGQQLGTGADAIAHRLGPVRGEIGIIAARRSLQPWFSRWLPGDDDGVVSVASTRLDEMRDFIVVDTTHTLILFDPHVRAQVRHFLACGRFRH